MNNLNNYLEINKINSQLERAEKQKIRLICNIYREYELYLKLVRDHLHCSVENGLEELYSEPSIKKVFLNSNEIFCSFEKKISKLIFSKLPLITVEQLKINKVEQISNHDINFNSLERWPPKTKSFQKEKFLYKDGLKLEESVQFYISEDISNASEYYQSEKLVSLDLDANDHINYLSNKKIIENIGLEKQFIFALIELMEEDKVEKSLHFENYNINQIDVSSKNPSLKNFDLIDKSLEKLLKSLSYKINEELYKANLIKKMISQNSFEYLVDKKNFIKNPHPYLVNFDINKHKSSSNGDNLSSIIFFNISSVELEFNNLNISIQKNKINELKNQFQRLIKKEKYWRQKEISLNKNNLKNKSFLRCD